MARKKSKKAVSQVRPAEDRLLETRTPESGDMVVPGEIKGGTGNKKPSENTSGRGQGVSLLTCMAGMFLCLVLGLYLGTLLPGVLADANKHIARPEVAVSAQQAPSGQPDNAGSERESGISSGIPAQLSRQIAELERKASASMSDAALWTQLGNLYFDANLPQKAVSAYEQSLRIAPGNSDVLTDLGIMYRELKQYEKAVENFRKASHADPRHENALFNEGVVLYNDLGKKEEARRVWQKLLDMNPRAHAPDGTPLSEMLNHIH